ncbi:hypothetical protein AZE42_04474 [Rhizopogon vesiculosus]|uniref:Cytochrome P450 n=1 Tax=Rhizopogon vesiculosus TaxID=180088 RepID=A0A1J8PY12_9AGAM|nr:hypothetical protein AZE42_04474 [Rhizopogon vesiculosus]
MTLTFMLLLVTLFALVLLGYRWHTRTPRSHFPPGPKPLPIIGNIFDLTTTELWLTAFKWTRTYGQITHVRVFSQSLVFLNTPKAIFDLLDKRGAVYSDKPHLVMAGELCGCENMVAFTPYGDRARRQRKLMQKAFGSGVISRYHGLMEMESRPFLSRLISSPARFQEHLRRSVLFKYRIDDLSYLISRYIGGFTLLVVYGHQVKSNDDPFLDLAEECLDILSNRIASGGGIWPVDIFPALKRLPIWFPGVSFKRNAVIWKAKMEEFVDRPYEFVKDEINKGTARPSFVSVLLETAKSSDASDTTQNAEKPTKQNKANHTNDTKSNLSPQDVQLDNDIRWTANSMYSASIDTVVTVLSHFILAMVQHPDVLARAQTELDAVLGVAQRLPTFEDRASLPYCDAVFTETLRWGVPVPLNLPHRVTEDDVYEGMFIPKGALIFGNIWAILRDATLYPDPDAFKPERWLQRTMDDEQEKRHDPRAYVFGFGRRRCPGNHLVDASVWLLMVSMLATLDIRKERDESGVEIEPVVKFENSVFRSVFFSFRL